MTGTVRLPVIVPKMARRERGILGLELDFGVGIGFRSLGLGKRERLVVVKAVTRY